MKYKDFMLMVITSVFLTFIAWGGYRLLLLAIGSPVPFQTWQSEMAAFLPVVIVFSGLFMLGFAVTNKESIGYVLNRFKVEEAQFRLEIVKESNIERKEWLEQKALEFSQESELLFNRGLLRKDGTFVKDWREVLLVTRKRLVYEEQRLLEDNKENLIGAMWMASLGAGLPAYYIFFVSPAGISGGFGTFFAAYWPIFSVVIIFEIVAIFYLRLYSLVERKIERNKNEITNIELRLTAGLMLFEKTNKDKFAELADTLSKEERNFILGKNESSAVLDTDKLIEIASKFTPKIGN